MKLLRVLGSLWLLPVTILVWVLYILPGWFFGALRWGGWHSFLIARFKLNDLDSPYAARWEDWYGWSGPNVMIIRQVGKVVDSRTERHEERHCVQQLAFGPLFYPAYVLSSFWIFLFTSGKHAYLDNPFERDARQHASQPVDIPPERWPDGPRDRWPWW